MVVATTIAFAIVAAAPLARTARSEVRKHGEAEVKAAFLYHFARYVQWPSDAFFSLDSPLVIGVLGDPVFYGTAEQSIAGKTVSNRIVSVRKFDRSSDPQDIHILFIGRSLAADLENIADELSAAAVFTIADVEGFASRGGVAHFYLDAGKVRFAVNPETARSLGLTISSKLLRVATIVQ